jgi:hypothetical protein
MKPNIITVSNVLCIWTLFLLLITSLHEWSRLVTLCNELINIFFSLDLYTVSKSRFDATLHNLTVSHVLYMWTLFLLFNTILHECSCLLHFVTNYSILSVLSFIPSLWLYLMQPNTVSKFLTFFASWLCFYCWTHFDTNDHG